MVSGISGANNYDYLQQMGQYGSKNGNISMDELFSKIDTNGDGSISKDEMSAFQSNMQTQFEKSVMGSQTDSASLLNLLAATINSTSATTAGSVSQSTSGSTDELFSKTDTNGDGSISKDELAKALTATHHHHHHHGKSSDATSQTNATSPLDQLFSKIDSNGGDGSISKDELSAFQSNLEAQLTGSVTGASTTTSTVSNQQSQANGIQSLLTNAISMYTQLSQLGSVISGIGSLAVTG